MADKKRQHYVPKFYMRHFSDDGKLFCIYDVKNKTVRPNVPLSKQCSKSYLYGTDIAWENHLQDLEAKWAVTFQNIIHAHELTQDDITNLKRFAIFQRQRTHGESEYRKRERLELLSELGKEICYNKGWRFDDTVKALYEKQLEDYSMPSEQLSIAENLQNTIDDLSVVVMTYDTEISLISSDVPVIAINPFYPHSIGYACMGLIMLFPISGHKLVVLYDAKMYPDFRGITYAKSDDCKEVAHLNTLQYISAEKILFSRSDTDFLFISDVAKKAREMNQGREPLTVLGVPGNQLFAIGMRKTIYECDWSFGRVSHRFNRVPLVCRQALPRKWDYKCEQNLNQKCEIWDMLYRENPQTFGQHTITGKELRRGCRRMASAAKVYWLQTL